MRRMDPNLSYTDADIFSTEGDSEKPLAWQRDALCPQTNPEAFFSDDAEVIAAAKKVCQACDVGAQCLAYALMNDEEFGIWGGKSERERRRLKRRGHI